MPCNKREGHSANGDKKTQGKKVIGTKKLNFKMGKPKI